MANDQDVVRKLKTILLGAKHRGKRKATTYAQEQVLENGTTVTDVADHERDGYVFVRYDDDEPQTYQDNARSGVSVRCVGRVADYEPGVSVWVVKDADGEDHVDSLEEAGALDTYGKGAASKTLPRIARELLKWIVPARNFAPLRAYQATEYGGLNVVIEKGFYGFDSDSHFYADTTPIDLTTVSVTSGYLRPVLIGIDPSTETPVLQAGDEFPATLPSAYTEAGFNAIIRTHLDKLWVSGYLRRSGITTWQTPDDLIDVRAFLSPGAGTIAGGSTFMPINLDYELTINANRQVVVDYMTTSGDGALINYGIVRTA